MKPIEKLFIAAALALPLSCGAYTYVSGKYDEHNRQSHKWSSSVWTNDSNQFGNEVMFKAPPGKRDDVQIRARTDMLVDVNVDVQSFHLNGVNSATFNGKNLITKKGLNFTVRWGGTASELILKKAKASIGGGIMINCGGDRSEDTIGLAKIKLEDSVLEAAGSMIYSVAVVNQNKSQSDKGGAEFHAVGKSSFNLKGEIFFDPLLLDGSARRVGVAFIIEERDGSVPEFIIGGGSPKDITFDIKVSGKAKKGKYEVFKFTSRKNVMEDFNKLRLNGRDYTLGTPVELGNVTATVSALPTKNGLLLEIK